MDVKLRRLEAGDIGQVVEIEREAFSPLWVSTPFKRELNNRYASYLVACSVPLTEEPKQVDVVAGPVQLSYRSRIIDGVRNLVGKVGANATSSSSVAGYVSVWYQGEEAHITEIAVREKLRGRGIGELLLIGSLRAALEYGSRVMTLEVRVSNFIAQRLYEKYDFKQVGVRKGYYSDNREDAAIMTTSPLNTDDYQKLFQELQESYRSRWGEIDFWT